MVVSIKKENESAIKKLMNENFDVMILMKFNLSMSEIVISYWKSFIQSAYLLNSITSDGESRLFSHLNMLIDKGKYR